jgi:hypothetical protein
MSNEHREGTAHVQREWMVGKQCTVCTNDEVLWKWEYFPSFLSREQKGAGETNKKVHATVFFDISCMCADRLCSCACTTHSTGRKTDMYFKLFMCSCMRLTHTWMAMYVFTIISLGAWRHMLTLTRTFPHTCEHQNTFLNLHAPSKVLAPDMNASM